MSCGFPWLHAIPIRCSRNLILWLRRICITHPPVVLSRLAKDVWPVKWDKWSVINELRDVSSVRCSRISTEFCLPATAHHLITLEADSTTIMVPSRQLLLRRTRDRSLIWFQIHAGLSVDFVKCYKSFLKRSTEDIQSWRGRTKD